MKKIFTLIVVCLTTLSTWAYDVKVDGIYYNLDKVNKTAEVTSGDSKYAGAVVIPESINCDCVTYKVTSIGDYAFGSCKNLISVTIPYTVISIGAGAFEFCYALDSLICHAVNVPTTSESVFDELFLKEHELHVPAGSVDAYKTTAPWNGFGTIKSIESSVMEKCATPTITFANGRLSFSCETADADFSYTITPSTATGGCITHGTNETVEIQQKLTVSCYASKDGFQNSGTATKEITIAPGDVNCDGKINVTDVTHLVDKILEK